MYLVRTDLFEYNKKVSTYKSENETKGKKNSKKDSSHAGSNRGPQDVRFLTETITVLRSSS